MRALVYQGPGRISLEEIAARFPHYEVDEAGMTNTYQAHDFEAWSEVGAAVDEPCIRTVAVRLRVPEIIVLAATSEVIENHVDLLRRVSLVPEAIDAEPLPEGVTVSIVNDTTYEIRNRLALIANNGMMGISLVALIVFTLTNHLIGEYRARCASREQAAPDSTS